MITAAQVYAFTGRKYWSARRLADGRYLRTRLTCSACGERAPHYQADYDGSLKLFTVPYAGLNGGIGEEIDAVAWADSPRDVEHILLSKCCDAPRGSDLRRLITREEGSDH